MGFDDLSNTGLLLGLGLPLPSNPALLSHKPKKPVDLFSFPAPESEPSLTLGLSTPETYPLPAPETADSCRQPSPHSAISSFSGGRVKRERDVSGEDIEEEKACSRVSDEDEDGSIARKKLRLTKEQSALLEDSFKLHSTLNPKQKQALARELNLRPRQVEVWFQNRRARTKLKQTEVDCEFLKRCCETLTDENRKLQKELQELKALKLAQPLIMQMPAATLTMCPSCERTGGGATAVNADGNSKSPFSMALMPRFDKAFTKPSAAC
ncbi:homeobox-leucine zipper protein HAT22 [Cucurbita pepo subsp. pepo]|uniref:homeobox-leucine zipper protein HAT22 n=1 Tax=Cucurbita pepo subsp. pepo TaxID=3664 RepID=UPI000C9D548F|nr:homeobox-leucine zipper protein HAT22 [Cucurbita pepo subsp. pepo]